MQTINFGGIKLTVSQAQGRTMVMVQKGVFSFCEYGSKAETQAVADVFALAVGDCCADPRPDCMGMCVPGIGGACKALRGEL